MKPTTLFPNLLELSIDLPLGLVAVAIVVTSVPPDREKIGFDDSAKRARDGPRSYVQQLTNCAAGGVAPAGSSVVVIEDSERHALIGAV